MVNSGITFFPQQIQISLISFRRGSKQIANRAKAVAVIVDPSEAHSSSHVPPNVSIAAFKSSCFPNPRSTSSHPGAAETEK